MPADAPLGLLPRGNGRITGCAPRRTTAAAGSASRDTGCRAREGAAAAPPTVHPVGNVALLPLVLMAGAYRYVTGGQVMSTDDAYVNAETVGISTDVSGIAAARWFSPSEAIR